MESHLLQMRGLKRKSKWRSVGRTLSHLLQMRGLKRVPRGITSLRFVSHLLQMRGLKLDRVAKALNRKMSHLLQMRGLKLPSNRWTCTIIKSRIFYRCVDWHYIMESRIVFFVASFTDAWIETSLSKKSVEKPLSHLLQMRGLKPTSTKRNRLVSSRIFYRCVDWN